MTTLPLPLYLYHFTFREIRLFYLLIGNKMELVFIYSAEFGRRSAGEGTNLDRRLVPYTRDARRIKSRIEFIL